VQAEAYLLEYAATLAPHRATRRVAAEYLAWCAPLNPKIPLNFIRDRNCFQSTTPRVLPGDLPWVKGVQAASKMEINVKTTSGSLVPQVPFAHAKG
jgi:hypothetical protein